MLFLCRRQRRQDEKCDCGCRGRKTPGNPVSARVYAVGWAAREVLSDQIVGRCMAVSVTTSTPCANPSPSVRPYDLTLVREEHMIDLGRPIDAGIPLSLFGHPPLQFERPSYRDPCRSLVWGTSCQGLFFIDPSISFQARARRSDAVACLTASQRLAWRTIAGSRPEARLRVARLGARGLEAGIVRQA